MTLDLARDVLFVGLGGSAAAYYRCYLPALELGCDWVGLVGEPPKLRWATGLVKDESNIPQSAMPDLFSYKVVVLQQVQGKSWRQLIEALKKKGTRVVYEVDDYLHGIPKVKDHGFREHFDKEYLWEVEQTMKACDALIASTEWIRGNYSHFCKRAYLCRNGIDLKRYALTRPKRPTVNVGHAGATGHLGALIPWLQQVASIMRIRENVCFVSIGAGYAEAFKRYFAEERAISVPWTQVEQYPAAMTMLDVALAPAGKGGWWRGKSDLRWLEAGALGIPLIANPVLYPDIEDGVTGFHARNPMEAAEVLLGLVDNSELRLRVGEAAKKRVTEARTIEVMADQWREVLTEVAG